MIIIETCPKCGHDLENTMICTFPPIPKKTCYNCGWHWEGKREEVVRVPFDDKAFDKGSEFFEDDKNLLLGDIGKEFVKRGYSEEDSKILANITEKAAISYNGVADIAEAANAVVATINGDGIINMKKLSDLK